LSSPQWPTVIVVVVLERAFFSNISFVELLDFRTKKTLNLFTFIAGTVIQEPILQYQPSALQMIPTSAVQDYDEAQHEALQQHPQQAVDERVIVENVGSAYPVVEIPTSTVAAAVTSEQQYVVSTSHQMHVMSQEHQQQSATSAEAVGEVNTSSVDTSTANTSYNGDVHHIPTTTMVASTSGWNGSDASAHPPQTVTVTAAGEADTTCAVVDTVTSAPSTVETTSGVIAEDAAAMAVNATVQSPFQKEQEQQNPPVLSQPSSVLSQPPSDPPSHEEHQQGQTEKASVEKVEAEEARQAS
jgi:hypothetical protein